MKIDRAEYLALCKARWSGPALGDARHNFNDFNEINEHLVEAMRAFHRDPMQEDISGKCLNPDGTLTEFLWKLQTGINPDKSSLRPLLDFEEHFQKVFLRRGLVIYCTLILRNLETVQIYSDALDLAFPA
jgi:hypothetical protein